MQFCVACTELIPPNFSDSCLRLLVDGEQEQQRKQPYNLHCSTVLQL
tara:strand:- start:252 stop:392 length:141 start_codon:yes stop_codon:yes gene_type:complete